MSVFCEEFEHFEITHRTRCLRWQTRIFDQSAGNRILGASGKPRSYLTIRTYSVDFGTVRTGISRRLFLYQPESEFCRLKYYKSGKSVSGLIRFALLMRFLTDSHSGWYQNKDKFTLFRTIPHLNWKTKMVKYATAKCEPCRPLELPHAVTRWWHALRGKNCP